VSLHRAEGFGITLAEAMVLGKPVIGTRYSGNLDFMTPSNSYLVDYELVAIGDGADPYPRDAWWAEPDVGHAARLMREVFDDPARARARGRRGQADVQRTHSREAAGRSMTRRLLRIQERWGLRAAGLARDSRGAVDALKLARRIARGPEPAFGRRLSAPRNAIRELVLRVIKPYSAHQRNVNEDLLHAIEALDNELQALAAGQAQLRPQVQRLVTEMQALPEAAAGLELAEHPVAGVVSGYTGGAAAAAEDAVAAMLERPVEQRRRDFGALVGPRKPVLELTRSHGPLRSVEDGSLGAVVATGVVERLSPPELPGFFELAAAKLAADGVLILETHNPHSQRVLKTFWADPTHTRPLFPEVGLALCRAAGFESAFVFHPDGSGNVEADRFYEASYALVAATEPAALDLAPAHSLGEPGSGAPAPAAS
jgi:hypothetical protein